jgi:hypothetical protein
LPAKGKIHYLVWTWEKNKNVKTKKRGEAQMNVWKRWYQRRGWEVRGSQKVGFVALHPDHEWQEAGPLGPDGIKAAISLHTYCVLHKIRLYGKEECPRCVP